VTAELLAALLPPCHFHAHDELRLPSGVQFRQGLGAVRSGGPTRRTMVPKMRPARREATFAWNAQGA